MQKINTYNESQLHKSLKTLYSETNENSKTEIKCGPYIADIQTQDGSIIEIQTAGLSKLKDKIKYFTSENRKITVVFPLITAKYIKTTNPDTNSSSIRKSPVSCKFRCVSTACTGK